jgi:AcrR family transcriptional regulator
VDVSAKVGQGVRARVRAEVTEEILKAAKQHLAVGGGSALSLRAVARDVGMVSSAIYRYFPSRDDLITALIIDGYEQVAFAIDAADERVKNRDLRARWMAIGRAVRSWALAHPHEYGLIYGTPIPGYKAPVTTIVPVQRAAGTLIAILQDGITTGTIRSDPRAFSKIERASLGPVGADYPDVPFDVLARGLLAWMAMFGMITFELFGHLHNVVSDNTAFFDHELMRLADVVIG